MAQVSAQEIAREFGFTARHWTRQAAAGNIPGACQPSGDKGRWRFDAQAFRDWARENGLVIESPPVTFHPARVPTNPVRKPKRNPAPTDVVYFAICEGKVKIGVSSNVTKRFHSFRTASALPVELIATIPGSNGLETGLHKRFSTLHSHGEWFRLEHDLALYLIGLPDKAKRGFVQDWAEIENAAL